MQNYRKPLFAKGRVLKKESLDCLTEYPRELTELIYSRYSEGLLYGCEITYQEGFVYVSSGAVKYKEDLIIEEDQVSCDKFGSYCIKKDN